MDKGAHFRRCDFQVHSPRDANWGGAACISEEDRKAYAVTLIAAARDKGLQALAITDHHDVCFIDYARKAALEEVAHDGTPIDEDERIVVFPGIELTLAVPCQALLILDADFEESRLESVLTLMAIDPSPRTEAKTAQTQRLETIQSLSQLAAKFDEQTWLKGRYIILPNVTGEGQFSLLRSGMAPKYKEMPCVGAYVDGSLSALKSGPISILSGKDKNWGNKRTACIQTSDNRHADHRTLGLHTSWIKWAVPTAEGLRQACLAQESRIVHEQPLMPSAVIEAIHVSNSKFLGPIDLELNPQYNALIGGRGTGKSTILEYLRWALCDQPPGTGDEDVPNYQNRRARLIESTLKPFNATVDIECSINGVRHHIRRQSADGSLLLKIEGSAFQACTEADVRNLLPIQAYSQKQLSDVSVRIDELARFITAPIRSELTSLDSALEQRALGLRQAYVKKLMRQGLADDLAKRQLELGSLELQATSLRSSLSGLSEEDRAILDKGSVYDAAQQEVDEWIGGLRHVYSDVIDLQSIVQRALSAEASAIAERLPARSTFAEVSQTRIAALELAKAKLEEVARAMSPSELTSDPASPWSRWSAEVEAVRADYQGALARSTNRAEQMEQLAALERRLTEYRTESARMASELQSLDAAVDLYEQERQSWRQIIEQRNQLLDAQCQKLTENSGGAIRATVKRFSNAGAFVAKLKEALSGANIRSNKIEDLGEFITGADNAAGAWLNVLSELEVLALTESDSDSSSKGPTPNLVAAGLSAQDLSKIGLRLSAEDWLAISLVEVTSAPIFEYQTREGDFIAFANASAGQQATALLRTLLNEAGPPLLIDQPEEDLDNPVMQEIVQQIWEAKKIRQLIFVSHNANLVVNGDAELVVWCEYRNAGDQTGGKIAGEGAIDIPPAREAIKRIMEGGEAAFSLRREKYGF